MCFIFQCTVIRVLDESPENESLAKTRSRRTRGDRTGRAAALERLKSLKGSKNKYEVSEALTHESCNLKQFYWLH